MSLSVSLPAWEIATDLSESFNLPSEMRSSAARDLLRSMRFDQAPVMREQRLIGWVRTTHLVSRGLVQTRATLLDKCTILSRDTSVGDALKLVAKEHLVFLAGTSGVREFIVASDLDRHAVRCYLFTLLSELEMHLAGLVHYSQVSEEEVLRLLQKRDRKRYDAAAEKGMETWPVEYLVFSAYKTLSPAVPEVIDCFPGDPEELGASWGLLTKLRNCVAHPSRSLTADFDVVELASVTSLIEEFVARLRTIRGVRL